MKRAAGLCRTAVIQKVVCAKYTHHSIFMHFMHKMYIMHITHYTQNYANYVNYANYAYYVTYATRPPSALAFLQH